MSEVRITGEVLEFYKERARQERAKAIAGIGRWLASLATAGLDMLRNRAIQPATAHGRLRVRLRS